MVWILTCMATLPVLGQNNPYKIDDGLYRRYVEIYAHRGRYECLAQADSLYEQAKRMKDHKAQCIILTIPLMHYYQTNNQQKFLEAAKRCKETARQLGFPQYYYHTYVHEINLLLNNSRPMDALKLAHSMHDEAKAEHDDYGLLSCLRVMGNIYSSRSAFRQAINCYQEALEYMQQHLPEQDPSTITSRMAELYSSIGDRDKTMEYAHYTLKHAKTEKPRIDAHFIIAKELYKSGKTEEFLAYYRQHHMDELKQKQYSIVGHTVHTFYLMAQQRYDEAKRSADSTRYDYDRNHLLGLVCEARGDYKGALQYLRSQYRYLDSIKYILQTEDLAEFDAQLSNEKLKQEAQALQLANTELDLQNAQLSLRNTQIALAESHSKAEISRINAEKARLELEKRELEVEQLKSQSEQDRLLSNSILISILLIIAGIIAYTYQHLRNERKLKQKNKELIMARDRAQQSEQMKTRFIQNMSHEIRTPLNSIVGFSELLSTPGLELNEEERAEYSRLVRHNSQLLTTLINDVLDLAALESGRYTLQIHATRINELCRQSIATVSHRVPPGVKLYFTTEVDDEYFLRIDAQRVQQVLVNFLTNAEKHTTEGEIHLHFSLSELPGKCIFSVTDTGSGIPTEQSEEIFERFKKLDAFTQGTGLGLNICRTIAALMQGEVQLDTHYTQGARFLFVLPARE